MQKFLFDTADVEHLKRVWRDLEGEVSPKLVVGITTNPAIMNRAGKNSFVEWLTTFKELAVALYDIKGEKGELHVQFPSSGGTIEEICRFSAILDALHLPCKLVIKVPPWAHILRAVDDCCFDLCFKKINCTGLCEAGTILKATNHVEYCSIIPGRMLKHGLLYKEQLLFATQNANGCEIIAGALYDADQVAECMQLGAVCTIGLKTWDLIIKEKQLDKLINLAYPSQDIIEFMPPVTLSHTQLSRSFFMEMDQYGQEAYSGFHHVSDIIKTFGSLPIEK